MLFEAPSMLVLTFFCFWWNLWFGFFPFKPSIFLNQFFGFLKKSIPIIFTNNLKLVWFKTRFDSISITNSIEPQKIKM
jgi:hypothetical protein